MGIEDDRTVLAAALGRPRAARIEPGTRLNDTFQIDALVGRGGMSEIYRGHTIQTDDPVAIKVLLPESAADEGVVSLFRREALMLNRLGHEAIVRYHVFSHDPAHDLLYLAMEFVDGPSLREFIAERPLSQREACALVARVADGMAAAHDQGIVHRDLSADNIVLQGADVTRPKVVDFGIARSGQGSDATVLQGGFAGKMNYVSPEQVGLFGGRVGPASDVYSLGLVFAAALRGRALDMGGSHADVVLKRQRVPDLSAINPGVKPVLERMLEPDPARRPDGMRAVRSMLAPFAGEASRADDRDAHRGTGRTAVPPAARAGTVPAPRRRRSAWRVLIMPLVLLAAGALAWLATTPEQRGRWLTALEGAPAPAVETATEEGGKTVLRADDPTTVTTVRVRPASIDETPEGGERAEEVPTAERDAPPRDRTALVVPPVVPPVVPSADPPEPPADPPERPIVPPEPPVAPPAPPPESPVLGPVAWLENVNRQNCFFAAPRTGGTAHALEAFGRDIAAFQDLEQRYQAAFDAEPLIGARVVSAPQCAVVDAVAALRGATDRGPRLTLARDVVTPDRPMALSVSGIEAANVALYVVTPDATVANVTSLARITDEGLALEIPYEPFARPGEAEYLVLALESDRPLPIMKVERNPGAEEFLAALARERAETDAAVSASLAYLRKR